MAFSQPEWDQGRGMWARGIQIRPLVAYWANFVLDYFQILTFILGWGHHFLHSPWKWENGFPSFGINYISIWKWWKFKQRRTGCVYEIPWCSRLRTVWALSTPQSRTFCRHAPSEFHGDKSSSSSWKNWANLQMNATGIDPQYLQLLVARCGE